jgi:peroxiredoxin Q/BCP
MRALLAALGTALRTAATHLLRPDSRERGVELAAGHPAPDFTLDASDGHAYRLSALRGCAVVIAWFPKAFTHGCTAECRSLGALHAAVNQFEAMLFAASGDTVETNRAFAASLGIDVPILSDPDARVARAYGALGPLGLPRRWTFYIGADGRMLAVDRTVRTGSHGTDVVAMLEKLGVPRRPGPPSQAGAPRQAGDSNDTARSLPRTVR